MIWWIRRLRAERAAVGQRDSAVNAPAHHPLTDTQARVAVAASLLRQPHAIVITPTAWDPAIAAGLDRAEQGAAAAA